MIMCRLVQAPGIDLHQRAGQEVGLLLVVPFQDHAVAARHQRFQGLDDPVLACSTGPSARWRTASRRRAFSRRRVSQLARLALRMLSILSPRY
jgi:hypothetical protein